MNSVRGPAIDPNLLERELTFSFSRSSGPGGQNVNKVNSKVLLSWTPAESHALPDGVRARFLQRYGSRLSNAGELQLTSERFRDQKKNRADAIEKLQELIKTVLVPPKRRRKTRPSKGSVEQRLQGKKKNSQRKASRKVRDE